MNISAGRPWMRSSLRSFYVRNIQDIFMEFFYNIILQYVAKIY